MRPLQAIAGLIRGLSLVLALLAPVAASAAPAPDTACGGSLETEVWTLWKGKAGPLLRSALLDDGLLAKGDTYALYDLQGYLQNLVAMAARCGRTDALRELSQWITPAFGALSELPGGPGWVCRGGRVCNAANRLIGTEVVLNSSQFMALLTRLASALAPVAEPGSPDAAFIDKVATLALAHLDRWSAPGDPLRVAERLPATPASVTDASSRLLYNDTDLWALAIHAELAGLAQALPAVDRRVRADGAAFARRQQAAQALLRLTHARISVGTLTGSRLGTVTAAEIDRGFWRLYPDSRYARYTGAAKPVDCSLDASRRTAQAAAPAPSESAGWDISHARRLVHALDALTRQRQALKRLYGLADAQLPAAEWPQQFAHQLAARIWNGDRAYPLFSNFWDGSPGWYRAGYEGSGRCFEGNPPGSLSEAFITGGYIAWGQQVPVLREIGLRLYTLSVERQSADAEFLKRFYPGLADGAGSSARTLTQLMFWPSLIGPTQTP